MELAGLGSAQPYASGRYMSIREYRPQAIYSADAKYRTEMVRAPFPRLMPKIVTVCLQPGQQGAYAAGSQADAGIRRAVIKMERVAVRGDGVAAGKDYIVYVPAYFVGFLWPKDPLIATL